MRPSRTISAAVVQGVGASDVGLAYIQAGRLARRCLAVRGAGAGLQRCRTSSTRRGAACSRQKSRWRAATSSRRRRPSRRVSLARRTVRCGLPPGGRCCFNDLPSRDGLARVAIARGDLDGAINIYRDLLRYGPGQQVGCGVRAALRAADCAAARKKGRPQGRPQPNISASWSCGRAPMPTYRNWRKPSARWLA